MIMNKLLSDLLKDHTPLFSGEGNFWATLNEHGLYNTFQFVLRLSPAVHRKLAAIPDGITTSSSVDLNGMIAMSTYLHETIHWWQHIGSTYGFVLSMTNPTQAYANYNHLKEILDTVGFKKSILQLAKTLPGGAYGSLSATANTIINNNFDIASFRNLTINLTRAMKIVNDPLFECVGHSYATTYGNIINLLSITTDRCFNVIPNPSMWKEPFQNLRDSKIDGYYYGSAISLYPIGAHEIFEGQARMAQLQYLHFATNGNYGMEAADQAKMFEGVYGKAFSTFLQLAELERPNSIDHPIIALFLLICDLAINPGAGFPFPLHNYSTFIHDIEPGARFVSLSRIVRLKHPELINVICDYSRDEYETVSEKLCSAIVEASPLQIAKEFCRWGRMPEFSELMSEYESFRFDKENTVVRVFFSHFLTFMCDKFMRPEFFCWPGAWMAGKRCQEGVKVLFDRHSALFFDKEDDDGIFPRILPNRIQSDVYNTFQDFYSHTVVCDLTRQWIYESGPFSYDYQWLAQNGSDYNDIRRFAERCFGSVYGVNPGTVSLV